MASRRRRVARRTSGLIEVVITGPSHSRTAGMTRPAVLNEPAGPKHNTEWQLSTASSSRPHRPPRRPSVIRPGRGARTISRRSRQRLAHCVPCSRRRRSHRNRRPSTALASAAGRMRTRTRVVYMPTGPGSIPRTLWGQARRGSPGCLARWNGTLATSARLTGSQWWAPNSTAATWPTTHSRLSAADSDPWGLGDCTRSGRIRATSFQGSDGLRLPQAGPAAALAVRGVVGGGGVEGRAALAVGLAGVGVAGGHAAAIGTAGAVQADEPADGLLGLAAPHPVLLASSHREGQAVVPHRAGGADCNRRLDALVGVGEERVVVRRHQVAAGGPVTPRADLGHAAVPSRGRFARAARLTLGDSGTASDSRANRTASGNARGCFRSGPRESWGSADASEIASGTQREHVGAQGLSGIH